LPLRISRVRTDPMNPPELTAPTVVPRTPHGPTLAAGRISANLKHLTGIGALHAPPILQEAKWELRSGLGRKELLDQVPTNQAIDMTVTVARLVNTQPYSLTR
jgi:hypothetical protein